MRIFTVTGYKGGIGKSTTSFHLATYLSALGRTVLIDGDPNRTAVKWAARGRAEGYETPFAVADEREAADLVSGTDYLVIDTPARPDSGDMRELAAGCDLLILPTSPDIVSLEPMLDTARELPPTAHYRALITVVPPYPSREGEVMQTDLRNGGIPVFRTMIRRTVAFGRAALAGRPLRDMDDARTRAAWADYQSLGTEIMEALP